MGPEDDPEAFLTTFERVMTTAQWPSDQWAILLAPYLMGLVQATYQGLGAETAQDHPQVRPAILEYLNITEETFRQRFWGERYSPGAQFRVVVQKLRDLCWRWLNPEGQTGVQVAELMRVEKFAQILLKGGRDCVHRHRPESLTNTMD